LIHECGFYTLSNGHRLFVMPYTGSTLNRSHDPNEPVRFMWQLSFMAGPNGDDRADGSNPHTPRYTSLELHQEALRRTHQWHAPVTTLITHTSTTDIWGTMLRDRNPSDIGKFLLVPKRKPNVSPPSQPPPPQYINPKVQRVIIIGDAIHGMSPFKGQGANQCFKDAVCVSTWLYQLGTRNLRTAIQFITREIIQRTEPIVQASRRAAKYWHTIDIPTKHNNNDSDIQRKESGNSDFTFAGIDENTDCADFKHQLLLELQNRNVNAGTTPHLDETIRHIIMELSNKNRQQCLDHDKRNQSTTSYIPVITTNVFDTTRASPISDPSSMASGSGGLVLSQNGGRSPQPSKGDHKHSDHKCHKESTTTLAIIIEMAYRGYTSGLRKVSWTQPNYLRQLKLYCTDFHDSVTTSPHYDPILWNEERLEGSISSDTCPRSNNIDQRANHWTTILHIAIIGGHTRTIHWLITEAGCPLEVTDSWERTVFDMIEQRQQQQIRLQSGCANNEQQRKKHNEIQELLQRLQHTSPSILI
jgi:FAD binding domain